MGDARRRGTPQQRKAEALGRLKAEFVSGLGVMDANRRQFLQAGLQPFLDRIGTEQWQVRRSLILQALRDRAPGPMLETAPSVRIRDDEIGWYLFLAQQALDDPACTDISQAQRILPFIVGLGSRWHHAGNVEGLHRKLGELVHDYKQEPDGLLFEILVALAYAEAGWQVLLIEEGPTKTADMRVQRGSQEFFVECKRQERSTDYALTERNLFLRQWDRAKPLLLANRQWIWMRGDFHVELKDLPASFLEDVLRAVLPLRRQEEVLHDSELATIRARLIDRHAVRRHFEQYQVKANSPMLAKVLGGDWAPENSATTFQHMVKTSHLAWCDVPVLGTYIDDVAYASGFTREVDAEASIDKKAKDITKLLSKAVKQVPADRPSIIHVAAETMEGAATERRRTEKVMARVPAFITEKPVVAVRFHRLLGNQRSDLMFEMDETVDQFQIDGVDLTAVPHTVVVPSSTQMRSGSHWNLYP